MNTHEQATEEHLVQLVAESREQGNSMIESQTSASQELPAMDEDQPDSASESEPEESAAEQTKEPDLPALDRTVINKFQSTPELRVFFQLLDRYDFDTGDDLADPDDVKPMQWQTSPYASRIEQLRDSLTNPEDPAQIGLLQEIIDCGSEAGASAWLTDAAEVAAALQNVSGEIGKWMQEKEAALGAPHPFADHSSKMSLASAGFLHFGKFGYSERARVESISESLGLPETCASGKIQLFSAPGLIADGGSAVDAYYAAATSKIVQASFENIKASWHIFNGQDSSVYAQLLAEHPEIERHELKLDINTFAPAKCDQSAEMTMVLLKWKVGEEIHRVVVVEDCPWTSVGSYRMRDSIVGSDVQAATLDFTHELMSEFCQTESTSKNVFAQMVTPNAHEMYDLIERINTLEGETPMMLSWETFEEEEGVDKLLHLELLVKKASDYFPYAGHLLNVDQPSDQHPVRLGQFSVDLLGMMYQATTPVPIRLSRDSPCIALSFGGMPAVQSLLAANQQERKENRASKITAVTAPGDLQMM